MSLRYYQAGAIRYVHEYENDIPDCRLCVYGPTGCVSGDTLIGFNRAGKGYSRSIRGQLTSQSHPCHRRSIPTKVRSLKGDTIGLHTTDGVRYSGMQQTHVLTLENRRVLRATADHRILTSNGFVELENLKGTSRIIVGGSESFSYKKPQYRVVQGLLFHPYASHWRSRKEGRLFRVAYHRLVLEAAYNGVTLKDFIRVCRTDSEKAATFTFFDPVKWAVHHRDRNPKNNSRSNLELITHDEHRLIHAEEDNSYKHFPNTSIAESKVKKIELGFVEDTYDIVCDDPYHNFVANGIVIHNSGKTHIATDLLLDPVPQILFTHRRVLLDQTAKMLDNHGIRYGIRAAGFEPKVAPIQLAMVQSEFLRSVASKRLNLHPVRRVHIDEPHAMRGPVAARVMGDYHRMGASVIGYTASPVDLGGLFDDLYISVTIPQLIAEKFLVPPVAYAIEQPNPKIIDRLATNKNAEYSPSTVGRIVNVNAIKGRVLEAYHRLKTDRGSFILYAHSVKTSIWWAQFLTAHGVPTAHIDGSDIWADGEFTKSTTDKRQEVFDRVESGDLKGMSNRFVLREGVDLPCIDHVILTCVKKGTLVLTNRGEVPIEELRISDMVWDGVEFVSHKGAICRGVRPVVKWGGLVATPDHKVLTKNGWIALEEAARKQEAIVATGRSGVAVRVHDYTDPHDTSKLCGTVSFFQCPGSGDLGGRVAGNPWRPDLDVGPYRQRRPLRAGQSSMGHSVCANTQPPAALKECLDKGVTTGLSLAVGGHSTVVYAEVWDILDAGPRHRFTANGKLVANCPVGSRVSIVQMCGRALRPYPGKSHAVLQDHSGSLTRHPPIDKHVTWHWDDATGTAEKIYIADLRNGKEREPIICPQCCFMRYFGDTCPQCGFKYNKYCRYVQQTDGTIKLIEGKAYRPRRIVRRTGDEAAWERVYWATRKNKPTRTFEQIYTFYAVSHDWKWLPRNLPLMPRDSYSWFRPVGDVPMSELIPKGT